MSRTDKDRPWWVTNFQDGPELYDHDHRYGKCIEESLELVKFHNGYWRHARHHDCNKSYVAYVSCNRQMVNGRKENVYELGYESAGYWLRDIEPKKTCWHFTCDCEHEPYEPYVYFCKQRYFVACTGHYVWVSDRNAECVCDDWPERPTCDRVGVPEGRGGYRRYTWGGVPSEFVRTYYHKPERARERKLNDYAREYNTYGELEDGDFDNRQARNSARWLYW